MREYLFRGKMIANGKWSEGNLLVTKQGCCITPDATVYVAVDPETVGQYTGLTDKNGKKIFEGDICNFSNCSDIDNYGVVVYDADETEFGIDYGSTYLGLGRHYHSRDIEVIGNIYDNPELLGGENND